MLPGSHRRSEFLQQGSQLPDLVGLPASYERGEPVQADLLKASHLAPSGGSERHQPRAAVSGVSRDLHVARILKLPDLPGDQGRVNELRVGDLGRPDAVSSGYDLQQVERTRIPALALGPLQPASQREKRYHHRLHVIPARRHYSRLI